MRLINLNKSASIKAIAYDILASVRGTAAITGGTAFKNFPMPDVINLTIYQKSGTTFTKLADPAVMPVGACNSAAWSSDGEFMVVAHITTPFITIYQRSGTTFTKLADPLSLPAGAGNGIAWSTDGEFLVVAHTTTPFITIYQRSVTTFTKLANPAALPAGNGGSVAWSPNGEFLAVVHDIFPCLTIYQTDKILPVKGRVQTIGTIKEGS